MEWIWAVIIIGLLLAVILLTLWVLKKLNSRNEIDLTTQLIQEVNNLKSQSERFERLMREEWERQRGMLEQSSQNLRSELLGNLNLLGENVLKNFTAFSETQQRQFGDLTKNIALHNSTLLERFDAFRTLAVEQFGLAAQNFEQFRAAHEQNYQLSCNELFEKLRAFNDSIIKSLGTISETQQKQLGELTKNISGQTEGNLARLEQLREVVAQQLKELRDDNSKRLEAMRQTVDEKLQSTLEKRLSDSFKMVGEQLEKVYKGLGEMHSLATGVGDLKRVLTNVKARGTWGEVQLGAMLEQVLNQSQYDCNVSTRKNSERVEFAVKLPGRGEDEIVYLPIDAKFPIEDYQMLLDAQEAGDAEKSEVAAKQLERRISDCAKDICEKYIAPPNTTDFAIMYLPTEGLFAEVLRRPGLTDTLQQKFRVVVAGPTTLWSILNSLQLGFRTLAIEKRSSEVWKLLEAVKTEWVKYGDALENVNAKLRQASDSIDKTQTRVRAIGRKLREVNVLPQEEQGLELLGLNNVDNADDSND